MAVGLLYRRIKNSLYIYDRHCKTSVWCSAYVWTTFTWEKTKNFIHPAHFREEELRFSFLRRRITTDVIRPAINASCRNEARAPRRIFGGRRLFGRRHASVKNLISPSPPSPPPPLTPEFRPVSTDNICLELFLLPSSCPRHVLRISSGHS